MVLSFPVHVSSFDRTPAPHEVNPEWVRACLHHHAMTRHLAIRVRAEDALTILEGDVPTRSDKAWAGRVAEQATQGGSVDNRLHVVDDDQGTNHAFIRSSHHHTRQAA